MKRFALILFIAITLLGIPAQVGAQSGVEISDVGVTDAFGEHITFKARILAPIPITNADLVFREDFDEVERRFPLEIGANGITSYRFDISQNLLRPFVTITYWFEVSLQDGQTHRSQEYKTRYLDDRFTWNQREDGELRIHWYDGDAAFGDALIDTARRSLKNLKALLPALEPAPVDIYVYASPTDLQEALFLGGESWQAGHANPKLNVVMLAVAPGIQQSIEMERLIPHELAHVLLYRSTGEGVELLPAWLDEGLASLSELYPNPDYEQALAAASQDNSLMPITELCDTFPVDASRAYLAYAESQSFVRFIRDTYGTPSLQALISAYADGLSCEQGAARALNTSLSNMEGRWRESVLGENPMGVFFRNMLPYFGLLGFLLLIPLIGYFQRRPEDDREK